MKWPDVARQGARVWGRIPQGRTEGGKVGDGGAGEVEARQRGEAGEGGEVGDGGACAADSGERKKGWRD